MQPLKALILSLLFLILNNIASADSLLRCGVVTPQTGPLAPIGTTIKNAIILASQMNPLSSRVEFIYEDDQYQAKNTVAAVRKLLNVDTVHCLIVFGSTTSLAVADIAERARIPMVSIAITPKIVENRSYVFRSYIPIAEQNKAIISEVHKRKYRSVALVSTIHDATLAVRDAFIESKVVPIVHEEQISPEDRDFSTIATKIKSLGPDAVFMNVLPPQIGIFAKQVRKMGYQGNLFSGPPLGNTSEIFAAEGALNDAWFVSINSANAQDFYKNYEEAFHEYPAVEGIYGFDTANLIINNAEHADIYEKLKSLQTFSGTLGTYPIVDHTLAFPAGIWKVIQSSFEYCGQHCS